MILVELEKHFTKIEICKLQQNTLCIQKLSIIKYGKIMETNLFKILYVVGWVLYESEDFSNYFFLLSG